TPRTRQILKLCYVERKKYREVAVELQISESAVKKHIMQALSYMRQKFRTRQFY
ncbi:RNA polymerase sigma factor, partial [Prevotella sp.]